MKPYIRKAILSALIIFAFAAAGFGENENAPSAPLVRITQMNVQRLQPGEYRVRGFVKFIHTQADCPACPPGAVCEACQRSHILVNEINEEPLASNGKISNSALVIYIHDAKDLKVGRYYQFVIAVPEEFQIYTGESSRAYAGNIELRSAEEIKSE